MSREIKYKAIILKKQPLGEGDEIITFYSKEQGKIRGLAKSVKSAKSKLQQSLQALFLVDLELAGRGGLPKIIGAQPVKVFMNLRENLEALKTAFVAAELILKFAPDEEKNERLFEMLEIFLEFLNSAPTNEQMNLGLAKFKLAILTVSGFSIIAPKTVSESAGLFFSAENGGFVSGFSGRPVKPSVLQLYLNLKQISLKNLPEVSFQPLDLAELQHMLSEFIEYQLERHLKSEKYLNAKDVV
ncbi:MAG: DNA repair protein RecO [Candidatus Doudnabacteria bacterium]|nr:DNA repair protein RecO [Candidatus Doudnabacteria bacterium]